MELALTGTNGTAGTSGSKHNTFHSSLSHSVWAVGMCNLEGIVGCSCPAQPGLLRLGGICLCVGYVDVYICICILCVYICVFCLICLCVYFCVRAYVYVYFYVCFLCLFMSLCALSVYIHLIIVLSVSHCTGFRKDVPKSMVIQ